MQANIKVSGNIISELSEKIPSNIIALNELIKNSYDAGANNIEIIVNTNKKKLIIKDDGSGMDYTDINTLFHISASKKQYGKINQYGRHVQGSKGLGCLAVFKFGKLVTWKTNKNKGLVFSVKFNELVESDNISEYKVEIIENDKVNKGTEIEIDIDEYNLKSLCEYLLKEQNYEKLVNAFDNNSVSIKIIIDDMVFSNEKKIDIRSFIPDRQLFNVKYNSDNEKIEFYYRNKLISVVDYKFTSKRYKLELDIVAFSLRSGDKSKISKLFYNNFEELTPIIYVNDNIFNNYEIFNPNVMKSIKYDKVINQMIGYVKIINENGEINFNSDRTQFLQNDLTDEIKKIIENINIKIQTYGSEYKKYFRNQSFLKDTISYKDVDKSDLSSGIKDDFVLKEFVEIEDNGDGIKYKFGDNEIIIKKLEKQEKNTKTDQEIRPAEIQFKNSFIKMKVNGNQKNLYEEISRAINSVGEDVTSKLEFNMDGNLLSGGILPTMPEECTKIIKAFYTDPKTGYICKELRVDFEVDTTKLKPRIKSEELIKVPNLKSNYNISYNNYVTNIVNQINSLSKEYETYKEIIVCSIRAIFEITIDSILNCDKQFNITISTSKTIPKVIAIIDYIKTNKKSIITKIAENTNISFHTLENIIDTTDYEKVIKNAHLGAHGSTSFLTNEKINDLLKDVSYFIVIANEMINNENIQ